MSEWLKTGEMIDQLKVGEVAALKEEFQIPKKVGNSFTCVTKDDEVGDILWCTENKSRFDKKPLQLFGHVCNWKWRILPRYVSVHEAFSAYFEGKTIVSHMDEIEGFAPRATFILDDGRHALAMDKDRIKLGKWTIEEDQT